MTFAICLALDLLLLKNTYVLAVLEFAWRDSLVNALQSTNSFKITIPLSWTRRCRPDLFDLRHEFPIPVLHRWNLASKALFFQVLWTKFAAIDHIIDDVVDLNFLCDVLVVISDALVNHTGALIHRLL